MEDKILNSDHPVSNNFKCSPGLSFADGSCYPLKTLLMISKEINKKAGNNLIDISSSDRILDRATFKKNLVKQIEKYSGDDQMKWASVFGGEKIYVVKTFFRPEGPEGKFTWLSNYNIDEVLKQYELEYPHYLFLGAVPRDFDIVRSDIKNLDFEKLLKEGKTIIGIVFNLDNHNQGGSHWTSMIMDIGKSECYYSDSFGKKPVKEFINLINRFKDFCYKINNKFTFKYNKTAHQSGNNACGVYSIYFQVKYIQGKSFDELSMNYIPDAKMNKYRDVFFTKPS